MRKHDKLVIILADAVESLVELAAAVDAAGTISRALKAEPRIWDYLSKDVVKRLEQAYRLKRPNTADAGGGVVGSEEQ